MSTLLSSRPKVRVKIERRCMLYVYKDFMFIPLFMAGRWPREIVVREITARNNQKENQKRLVGMTKKFLGHIDNGKVKTYMLESLLKKREDSTFPDSLFPVK